MQHENIGNMHENMMLAHLIDGARFEGRYNSENGKQSIYLVCVRLSFMHTLII